MRGDGDAAGDGLGEWVGVVGAGGAAVSISASVEKLPALVSLLVSASASGMVLSLWLCASACSVGCRGVGSLSTRVSAASSAEDMMHEADGLYAAETSAVAHKNDTETRKQGGTGMRMGDGMTSNAASQVDNSR